MELIVAAAYDYDTYTIAKVVGMPPYTICSECGAETCVETDGVNICHRCLGSVAGECGRCSQPIGANNYNQDYPDLCDYCGYVYDKAMRERQERQNDRCDGLTFQPIA
ncbi:MAG: hypothetical protein OXC63_12710 [Aestuariivita sp.]|nr:hypothetical protein [Aestuariivita sp.]MCY4346666.1 hypothetical protein [Aestuariivita sp.]